MMNKVLLKSILAAGLWAMAGNAMAVKSINSLTGSGNQGSTQKTIERQDVLDAVAEVCRVWNTPQMMSMLDPAFPDPEAFKNSFGILPKDAKLVLRELVVFTVSSTDVVAQVRVAIEFQQDGVLKTDTPRLVTWTFKRQD